MKKQFSFFAFCVFQCMFLMAQKPIKSQVIPQVVTASQLVPLEKLQCYFDQPFTFDSNGTIRLSGQFFSQSNAIPTQFSNVFLFPTFITEEMKSAAYDRLKTTNHFGAELNASVIASFSPDSIWKSQGLQFRIGIEQKSIIASQFSNDLFHVLFSGNAAYAGKLVTFDESSFTSIGYQSFKIGILQRHLNNMFSVDLGLVHGINYSQVLFNKASLFTQLDGSYLDINWQGNYSQTGRVSNQLKNQPSMGASIDLEARQAFNGRWIIHEQIQDLGFINWNQSSTYIPSDTSFRFSGLQFYDLLNFDKNTTLNVGDSLLNKLQKNKVQTQQMTILPALFRLEANRLFARKITVGASVQYRYIKGFQPMASIELGKGLGNNLVKLGFHYGGYGGFQTSLRAVLINKTKQSFSIGTYFTEGLINPKKWSGAGFQINYQHRL